jgi:hypothetical protein
MNEADKIKRKLARYEVLLKATLEILRKADDGPYVEDVLALTANYDGTECDGFCLMEDIEHAIEFGD